MGVHSAPFRLVWKKEKRRKGKIKYILQRDRYTGHCIEGWQEQT